MNKISIASVTFLSLLVMASTRVMYADSCGGPYGSNSIAVPTGNIAANGANTWITPIGADSSWSAINYGDRDYDDNQCKCVDDTIANPSGIKWVSTYMTNTNMLGTPKTLTAANDPHTGVGVKLELDDANVPANEGDTTLDDGGFVQVASQNVDIVIPDAETSTRYSNPACGTGTFGCDTYWRGTVSRAGFTLSFDHCQVTETSGSLDTDGCGLGSVNFGNGTLWLGISSNTWGYDHISACLGTNNTFQNGCTSQATLHWAIRSNGGTAHEYRTPTATWSVGSGGTTSTMTCSRS